MPWRPFLLPAWERQAARSACSEPGRRDCGRWVPSGARLVERDGHQLRIPVLVTSDPLDCQGTRIALVLVKSWQTRPRRRPTSDLPGRGRAGFDAAEWPGQSRDPCRSPGLRSCRPGFYDNRRHLAWDRGWRKPAEKALCRLRGTSDWDSLQRALVRAGFKLELVPDARALIWNKLVVNSAINPLTAILRVPNGQLLERPAALRAPARACPGDGRRRRGRAHSTGVSRPRELGRGRGAWHRRKSLIHVSGHSSAARRRRSMPSAARSREPACSTAFPRP